MNLHSLPGACFRVDRCQEKKFNFEEILVFAVVNFTLKAHFKGFFVDHLYLFATEHIGTSPAEKRLRRILFGVRNHELLFCPELTSSLDDNLEDLSGVGFFPQGSFKFVRSRNRCSQSE